MPTPWQSQAYRNVYEDLVRQMDPSSIRDKCFARGLITSEQRDDLSHLNGARHNRSLLSVLEKLNDDQYEVFCQVLLKNAVHVHDHSVAEMRKASDTAGKLEFEHLNSASSAGTGFSTYLLPCEADAGDKAPTQVAPPVCTSPDAVAGQQGAPGQKKKIRILAVAFDAMMYHGSDAKAWGHLDDYIAYLNQRCTNPSVDIKIEHIESTATSDAVRKTVEEVHEKATDLKAAGYEVIGMMVGAEENRLPFFHDEQSTSFRPVTKALESESVSNGIIVAVSGDVPSDKDTLLWRSEEVQLLMEMQLEQACFNGEKGVVLSWSRSITPVHARAIAMYALSQSFQPAELLDLQPCPDEINRSGDKSRTAKKSQRLSAACLVLGNLWDVLVEVGPCAAEALSTWHHRRNARQAAEGYQPSTPAPTPSKQKRANFVLVNIGGTGNPEVEYQMENFSRLCIPRTDEYGQASTPKVQTQTAWKVSELDIETYSSWISDTEDWYNVAVLFAAAQDYYEDPEMISQLASIFDTAGFKACIICALFDHSFWWEDNQEVARSPPLGRAIGSELEKCSLPVKVVSWWSRPSLAVAREVVEVWKKAPAIRQTQR